MKTKVDIMMELIFPKYSRPKSSRFLQSFSKNQEKKKQKKCFKKKNFSNLSTKNRKWGGQTNISNDKKFTKYNIERLF